MRYFETALGFVAVMLFGAVMTIAALAVLGQLKPHMSPGMHPATVYCPNIQEDSAAHVTLVDYGHGGDPLAYQCERSGY